MLSNLGGIGPATNKVNINCIFSGQGKQQRKFTVRQVLEQLEADSDFGPELDSDSDSD